MPESGNKNKNDSEKGKNKLKVVKVLIESKGKMKDKKGRSWLGMNKMAAKPNSFRKIKTPEVSASQSRRLQVQTARHEIAEQREMAQGKKYPEAHKDALKKEKYAIPGVKIKLKKAK